MTTVLRRLMGEKDIIIAPGVQNPLGAKVIERVGFDAVYMTGYGTSLNYLAFTDVGLLTETEMVRNVRYISNAVKIPLIADADTGYGNAINVMRTVRDYVRAGAAALHIEDQVMPKRCGHLAGKTLVTEEEMVGKLRAAIDTREEEDEDFVIIARTDARGSIGGSLDLAIKRGIAYAEAGADVIFSEFATPSKGEAEKFAKAIHAKYPGKPLLFNYSPSLKWYLSQSLTFDELAEIGYKIVILPFAAGRPALKAMWDYAEELKKWGSKAEVEFEKQLNGHPTEDFHAFSGFPEARKLEEKYLTKEEVLRKYESSLDYKP